MMPLVTLLLCCFLFAVGFVRYGMEPARARASGRAWTFLVDPPTMFAVGFVSVLLGLLTRSGRKLARDELNSRRRRISALQHVFILCFWTFELLSYFDVMAHPFDPSRSGNDFMMNGYVEWLTGPLYSGPFPTYHHWWSWPLLACMLLLQYGALRLGSAIGYMAARANDQDRGSGHR
jgi:hypothetical protein